MEIIPSLDVTRASARDYLKRGWVTLAYAHRTKAPKELAWSKKTLAQVDVDKNFIGDKTNVGILLGIPSANLVDVDLDCMEAVALAPRFLPATPARFGRKSKPLSHWLYIADLPKTEQHHDPTDLTGKKMLVELRSTGGQTMFPPSIHPSGEQVEWDGKADPAKVEPATIRDSVKCLALASVLLRNWQEGQRNELGLCAAGAMLSAGWGEDKAQWLLDMVMQEAGDRENRNPVETTRKRIENKEPIKGLPSLAEALGAKEIILRKMIGGSAWDDKDCFAEKDPNIIARAFALETSGIHHWRSDFYLWDGTFWKNISDEDLKSKIGIWLEQKRVLDRKSIPEAFCPTTHDVNEISGALARIFHILDVKEAPFWIDPKPDDPAPVDLLPFKNCVLNLQTFQTQEPTPRLFSLNKVDCEYKPEAKSKKWDEFLKQIFPELNDARIGCIEEVFGYCLTADTSQQKAFLWQGARRSGKGTLGHVLRALVGGDRWAGPTVSSFGNDFGLQQLIGKSVAMIADARGQTKHDPHVVVERILTITGEDAIGINRKNKSFWDGQLPTRLIYASNIPPKLNDPSGTIVSRFIGIPFTESFEGRENPKLTDELLVELPGIVNKVLEGLKRLRTRGRFEQPEIGKDLLDAMDENTGPVRNFVAEHCAVGLDYKIETSYLFQIFNAWAKNHNHHPMAQNTFGSDLFALNLGIKQTKLREGEKRKRYYQGITLAEIAKAGMDVSEEMNKQFFEEAMREQSEKQMI